MKIDAAEYTAVTPPRIAIKAIPMTLTFPEKMVR